MSEYWKSLPRKFCDTCKCWFADNKASIEFHEKGKRHQENVQKRIHDIQKRGIKAYKIQKEYEDDMDRIEKAALKAYKKDLQNNAQLCPVEEQTLVKLEEGGATPREQSKQVGPKHAPSTKKRVKIATPVENCDVPEQTVKKWYEAITEEGHKYYWNGETSETQWEMPTEGYVSFEEQETSQQTKGETAVSEDNCVAEQKPENEANDSDIPPDAFGPKPKIDPYGQWTTVEYKEPEQIDLQLPKPSNSVVEVTIRMANDAPSLKFKEKVIGQLLDCDPNEEVTFKKRKFNSSSRKNARQRTTDD